MVEHEKHSLDKDLSQISKENILLELKLKMKLKK